MTGSGELWDHYAKGQRIDHPAGMTLGDSDHMTAARLYQNNARAHLDARAMRNAPAGQHQVCGGHVLSVCHALAYDGLENVCGVAAINSGEHVAPSFAGDMLYAFSEVCDKWKLPGRSDVGALRIQMTGLKNLGPREVADTQQDTHGHPAVVLRVDYTLLMPRRAAAARLR